MGITIRDFESQGHDVFAQCKFGLVVQDVLEQARALSSNKGYAGDITPHQAWALLSSGAAELVDVRTIKELEMTGYVPGSRHVEWNHGNTLHNTDFIPELSRIAGKETIVLFICRSGKRSVAAAKEATILGYDNAFNVLEGIEGKGNPGNGWLRLDLPVIHD
jgi:rhodanese-related sulfurtransferase